MGLFVFAYVLKIQMINLETKAKSLLDTGFDDDLGRRTIHHGTISRKKKKNPKTVGIDEKLN